MAPPLERSSKGDTNPHLSTAQPRPEPLEPLAVERNLGEPESLSDRVDDFFRRVDELRDRPGAALLVALAITTVVAAGWWLGKPGSAAPIETAIPLASTTTAPSVSSSSTIEEAEVSPTEPETLFVHVAGAVVRPGIVELEPGARIGDAVSAAGGPTSAADLHRLNLAAPVLDGLQVRVPIEGEEVSSVGVPAATSGVGSDGGRRLPAVSVNPNTANEVELETLSGIGPALAGAIIDWRTKNGPFQAVEDLLEVPGIGPSKLAGLADEIVLGS